MKSPFPGMDPYIEACDLWGDFTHELVCAIARRLNDVLPAGCAARLGSREYTAVYYSEADRLYPSPPHVVAACRSAPELAPVKGEGGPVTLRAFIGEDHKDRYVNILDLHDGRRLVTRIEVLSRSAKQRGFEGWKQYLRRRRTLLLGKANLVEIDLLRGGDRMPMLDPLPASPYYLLVAREEKAPYCGVWPGFFDRPLPAIPIPLRKPDPDIPLALQPIIDAIYEQGRYGEDIDYSRPLDPPLSPEQVAWLARQLRPEATATKPPSGRRRRPRGR
jgi:hypothetical protein